MTTCPNCGAVVATNVLIPMGDTQVCPSCRDDYIQRLKETGTPTTTGMDEEIRQTHIKHEASLKSIGILYLLGGVLMILGSLGMLVGGFASSGGEMGPEGVGFMLGIAIFYLVMGTLMIFLAVGFRKLKRWVRIPSTIIAALGLLSFPIGTLINGYILYLIWSAKGKMVFSDEYKLIIEATPDIKYKTSPVVWVLLIILLLLLGGALAAAFLG
ncbi:hypothetical protein [Cerasicoccus maritimus]|uniref:hypothetical protein n=1 Tax=Cerasicoccus maritimus TaxID=490089 RepID=UPI0028527B65|nr:hypothetical protein [Cerasicoccus maritimus]